MSNDLQRVIAALLVLPALSCSAFAPWKQEILLETEPPGATILVDGAQVGKTPLRVPVRKTGATPINSNSGPKIVFKLPGYRDTQFRPKAQKPSLTGWFDLLTLTGLVTMYMPGFWSFDKETYRLSMEPAGTPSELFATPSFARKTAAREERRFGGGYSKRIAVAIGIDDYDRWPPLEGGTRDAKRIAAQLRELGFDEVVEVYDDEATRVRLLRLLGTELVERSDPESLVVIYFAGHGQTETLASGERRGYIVPVDADTRDSFATAISMEKIRDLSQRIPAKHLYYAMDSCYSGLGLTRGIAFKSAGEDLSMAATSRRAVQMLTAGGEGEQAIEVAGRGVFTTYLLEAMSGAADANADGLVSASEIGAFVRPRVAGASKGRQNPQFGTLYGGGEVLFGLEQR